jgi:hypothetical protein
METTPPTDQKTEVVSAVIALALALPILGIVIYGITIGWRGLSLGAGLVMATIAIVYYLILRIMMRYRKR